MAKFFRDKKRQWASFLFVAGILVLAGAGCAQTPNDTSNTEVLDGGGSRDVSYQWFVYNPALKTTSTLTFVYPSSYTITKNENGNNSQLVIAGPKGQLEITNSPLYDGPSPQETVSYGYRNEFTVYSVYPAAAGLDVSRELARIRESIVIEGLSKGK